MLLIAVLAAGIAAAVVLLTRGHGSGSEVRIVVAGRTEIVRSGDTLGEVASGLGLRPLKGDLLDVRGRVVRRGVVAGALLLDGEPSPASTQVEAGDRIRVRNGRDRREPVRIELVGGRGGALGDPEFTLERLPGREIVTRGAVSHEIASIAFRREPGRPTVPRAVALCFDDGPNPEFTPRVLRVLGRLHVHATFFLVGYEVDEYPDIVRAELRAGMTIGNHTYNHPEVPPFDQLPGRLVVDEIDLGAQRLERLGVEPLLFRPPGGGFSTSVVAAAAADGERVVLWSVDPRDWEPGVLSKQIVQRVLSAVRPGSIVILHDGGGDRSATVKALPAIVNGIRKLGLRLVTVPAY